MCELTYESCEMKHDAYYPEALELEAYGNGGFRFGEMSHKGSLLILQSGIYGWDVTEFDEVQPEHFQQVFEEAEAHEFLIFGTGDKQRFPSKELKEAFQNAATKPGHEEGPGKGLWLEVMDTGAAARTYNVLIAEGRKVAAAFIAVD
ncbi:MAG: membrane protein [Methyloligella sp.]|nr:MAG: membrane protein [Methyloligella sp.]